MSPGVAMDLLITGAEHHRAGRLSEAESSFWLVLAANPGHPDAWRLLGEVYRALRRFDAAGVCFRSVTNLQPSSAEAHYNLGVVRTEEGRWNDARECYLRALELRPDFAEALGNLGNVWKEFGQLEKAVGCYQQALRVNPNYTQATLNLATTWKNLGRLDEALKCYERTLQLAPGLADGHYGLGNVCNEQGRLDEAIASYRRALQFDPRHVLALVALTHTLQHLCEWADLGQLAQAVLESVENARDSRLPGVVSPFAFLALPTPTTAQQQLRCAQKYAARLSRETLHATGDSTGRPRRAGGESAIRIGYLSADFRAHALADLIVEFLERHDRRRFTVCGYSIGADDGGPLRRRIVAACDAFIELTGTSPADSARRIAADGIHILVDLTGYTKHCRPQILALRPAPIQVQYLGFPGTMGAEFIDYILVDHFVVPNEQQAFFTERLVHLPGCYLANPSRRDVSGRILSRLEFSLPEEGFVFCCFNNSYKITPDLFDLWMGLLREIPASVLWLFEGNRIVAANLRREAQTRGVSGARLVFAPPLPQPEHLARYRVADLFLDSFPYNAHTTASDALWAGCPVLTRAGETFASRVAGSLLRSLSLPELITTNHVDYRTTALRLARNPDQLSKLRGRLDANRQTSGLFDPGRFARHVEAAYTTMCKIHAAGKKPRPFAVSPVERPPERDAPSAFLATP